MKIRKATIKDVKELAKLSREYAKYENKLNKEIKVKSLKETEKEERNWIKLGTRYILAQEGDEILGMIVFNLGKIGKEKIGFIHIIIISEKARGKGVGKVLVKYVFNFFKKNKCRRVKSFVHIGNKKSFKFWTKHGFEPEKGFAIQKKIK